MLSFSHAILLLLATDAFVESEATLFSDLNLTVLERLPGVPQGWQQGAAVPGSKRLDFRIAIKQEGAFAFEQQVIAISTPDHPLYGQHMTQEEVRRMLRPSSKASAAIFRWLDDGGVPVTDVEDSGDWINLSVSASKAERILATTFHYYSNSANEIESIRTLRYSVPESLHKYIQLIQPTTRFPQIRTQYSAISDHFAIDSVRNADNQSTGLDVTFCNTTITPQCLKDLYYIRDYQGKAVEGMLQNFPFPPDGSLAGTRSIANVRNS
jgi:tripeptidyl-peptidase I